MAGRTATPKGIRTLRIPANAVGAYGFTAETYHLTVALEAPFTHVRLALLNASTSATWLFDRACVAPSAFLNDGFNPLDTNGSAVTWTNVTTNNSGADGQVPSPSGAATSLTVPVASATGVPSWSLTDWMPMLSYPRMDAGQSRPLLMARGYSAVAAQGPSPGTDYTTGWPLIGGYPTVAAYRKAGDCVTTPANFTAPGQGGAGDFVLFGAVQTYQQGLGFNIMALGDSLTQGYRTLADANSFVTQACVHLSTPGKPFCAVNAGVQGQTPAQFFARGYVELPILKPDIVIIEVASPNGSPSTQAQFNTAFGQAIAFADFAVRNGAVPILKTAVPFPSYSTTTDPMRLVINNLVRGLGASGSILVLDADAAVSNGVFPQAALLPGYLSPIDSLHMNDQAHAAIAAALVPILQRATA